MARSRIPFQKGPLEDRFRDLYGDEDKCRALVVAVAPAGRVCLTRRAWP
jgi:hypothetical protein